MKDKILGQLESLFPEKMISPEKISPTKISTDEKDLLLHAGDLWPRKLIRQRLGEKIELPLAVVRPSSTGDVQKIVQWANREKIALIPYGGGTGVCGGTLPVVRSVAVDLKELNKIKEINLDSLYVTSEAGILGGELEKQLNEKGVSLCHFPTAYAISTLGGWISTRASGQMSTAYGSIENMVLALKGVLPTGECVETKLVPRSATGFSVKDLFIGGEGTMGIVTEATCQVHRLPEQREFLSFSVDSVREGLKAIQKLIQKGIRPAVVRFYDEMDTQLALSEMGLDTSGNLLVLVFQGEKEIVQFQKEQTEKEISKTGKNLGSKPAEHWWSHRFDLDHIKLTQILSQEGMILDTIEVAAIWSHLESLYESMKKAISEAGVTILAHFSHFYHTGGSIYFTFFGNFPDKETLEKYDLVWERAMEACLSAKGTISHHHGIGLLRKKWIKRELESGWDLVAKIKKTLDPNDILNPQKMV